jgi:hypothetical protein
LISAIAPIRVPLKTTFANGTASLVLASTTVPLTTVFWAYVVKHKNKIMKEYKIDFTSLQNYI